jgi:poly(A) polymerase
MSKQKPEKQKMAMITEVYNRIIWDSRLNRNMFIAGFHERISDGIREKPLAHWEDNGDIPWHRIRYIRCGDVVVWDREQHLDLISTEQLPAIAWKSDVLESSKDDLAALLANNQAEFKSRDVYKYDGKEWKIFVATPKLINRDDLTVVSYNVLCNLYEAENIQTEKRLPAIIHELQKNAADIIALQEVTPELVEVLLQTDWVQDYFISESVSAKTVKPYGNLLMSRLPFHLLEHQFSGHKRALVGTWNLNNKLVHLSTVHLTSNRGENALQKRTQQLATVVGYLEQQLGDCLIVGDFNTRGDEQKEILNYGDFVDLWQKLHPEEDGYTFDPNHNPLAMLMSLEGEPARFDRILLRQGKESHYKPLSVDLFGCEPITGTEGKIYPSDHFGIRGVLEVSVHQSKFHNSQSHNIDLTTIRPVYQSAIVIIPPDELLSPIQAIRQRYDSGFARWMPHITLLCGFLPESYFEEVVKIIAPVLAKLEPFTVTFSDFQTFTHQKTSTAWLRPLVEPEGRLHELQNTLQQLFPQCYEQSTKTNGGFTPHLSVGQFSSPEEAVAKLPQWHPIQFTVGSVALVSRRGDEPCMVRHIVGLGKYLPNFNISQTLPGRVGELMELTQALEPELTQVEKLQRETVLEVVKQACTECLGFSASLHLLGSARLGVESTQSDLDVVCLIPNYVSGDKFLYRVENCLKGLCDRSQVVLDARVPVLRLIIENISLDLLYAQVEENGEWQTLNIQDIKSQIPNTQSIIGCWEADLITDSVNKYVSFDDFRLLLKAVRGWAKSRCIYGNTWGFLGGFSWALLCAWSCTIYTSNDKSLEALLVNFFQLLQQYDWGQPIALTDAGKQYEVKLPRDWLPIVSSIEPCKNTARNVTRSTAQILQQEFMRGAEITDKILPEISWTSLFEPIHLQEESHTFLAITATSRNEEELEKCCGILEGYIISLVIQLEQLDIFVRPIPKIEKNGNSSRLVLALNLPLDCEISLVERIGKNFILQLNGGINSINFDLSLS